MLTSGQIFQRPAVARVRRVIGKPNARIVHRVCLQHLRRPRAGARSGSRRDSPRPAAAQRDGVLRRAARAADRGFCLEEVRKSDLLVVIAGLKYGSLPPRMQAEYEAGVRLEKPCLVYACRKTGVSRRPLARNDVAQRYPPCAAPSASAVDSHHPSPASQHVSSGSSGGRRSDLTAV